MSDISVEDTKTSRDEARCMWVTHVKLSNGKTFIGESRDRISAVFDAKGKVMRYLESLASKSEHIEFNKDTMLYTSTYKPYGAKLGYEIDPNSNYTIAQHASHLEKLMTGLIEKAKREGCKNYRLLDMAAADFERGFMALEKAINTK